MSIQAKHDKSMNVILVTIDCLRYDRPGFNRYYRSTTPMLTTLAQESYVFNHAYATGPYTTESVPGIIAAQHSYNGVYFGDDSAWKAIQPKAPTIASHLQKQGYTTFAVLTNPHLTTVRNFDTGFESFTNLRTDGEDRAQEDLEDISSRTASTFDKIKNRFKQSSRKYSPFVLPFIMHRYYQSRTDWASIDGKRLRRKFCSQLKDTDEPFFAWTHFMDPHAPITPQVTSDKNNSLADTSGTLRHLYHISNHSRDYQDPTYSRIYDSAVRYVDHQIGEIIETLRSMGAWDETILIVTGDHGEVLGDRMNIHGHPRHHHYDESLHVPLLIRVPGLDGRRIGQPVSLSWMPKIVTELLDIPSGDFPYERGEPTVFGTEESANPPVISDSLDAHGHTISVRNEYNKLIHHSEDNNTLEIAYPYFENDIAFNYRTDPTERCPTQTELPQQMHDVVTDVAADETVVPNIRGTFSQSVKSRLEDLGYKME